MPQQFPVHGKTHIVDTGTIVRLYIEGPWNRESVVQTHKALIQARPQASDQPWGLMVITLVSALCGPDALDEIRATATRQAADHGRRATAWVMTPDVEGSFIMASAIRKVYEGINAVETFSSEEEAERWLLATLARP